MNKVTAAYVIAKVPRRFSGKADKFNDYIDPRYRWDYYRRC